MIKSIVAIQSSIFKVGLLIITILSLFLFWNITTEFFDTPKYIALIAFLIILLVLSIVKYAVEGKVVLTITPLELPFLLLIIVAGVSTFTSSSFYAALLGAPPRVHGSFIALIIYFLFYLLIINNLKYVKDVKPVIYLLISSGIVLSLFTLLTYAGIKLIPFTWAQSLNFTPTGGSFSTNSILVLTLPFILLSLIKTHNFGVKLTYSIILALFGVVIALTGSMAHFVAVAVALGLVWYVQNPTKDKKNLPFLILPAVVIIFIAIASFVKVPAIEKQNLLYTQAQSYPREIQLPFVDSWKVSVSAFRDEPFVGTGPSTYLYNFTQYKPANLNNTNFWNIRFDQPFNEYLGVLATLGGVGLFAFVLFTAFYVSSSLKVIKASANEYQGQSNQFSIALAISGLLFFVLLAFHASTLVLFVIGLILIASFFAINPQLTKTVHLRLGAIRSFSPDAGFSFDVLPVILLLLVLAVAGVSSYYVGKYTLADYHHRVALNHVVNRDGLAAYRSLIEAEKLNPYNDLYRTDIAQTNLALATAIAVSKGPSQASPAGSLTDQDKAAIQQFLQQSIAEARAAATINSNNPANWEVFGSIYRQISGVAQNALALSLDAYGRAIQRDPLNPNLRIIVGGIYYSIRNYDTAIRFFTDAVNLKPDLANAYYNLSIALRDKGDLQNAQAVAERLVSIVDPQSADFKVASDYLADLKARIATGSANASPIKAPAADNSGALQQEQLPNVIDLDEPEEIATPEAVENTEE